MKNKTLLLILLFLPLFLVGRSSMAESQTPKETAATGDALLAETGTRWQSKVEETLLGAMNSETGQDMVVLFSEKADLQTASALSWHDRGEMVLYSLRATAQTAQSQAVQLLEIDQNAYTSYGRHFSVNALCITGLKDVGLLRKIAALPEVARIFASPEIHFMKPVSTHPADNSQVGVAWGVQDINAPEIWASGHHGEGIVVGSIDTGVLYTHEALVRQYRGNLGNGAFDHNYNWYDSLKKDDVPTDSDSKGHGTHTVGTMVGDDGKGHQIGVAPEAQWIACRHGENIDDFLTCMDWMLAPTDLDGKNPNPDKRPHVVNNSWGVTKPAYSIFEEAVQSWRDAGIFPAFAAGNSGRGCETLGVPGGYDTSFTTGAYNADHEIANFSSRGPYPDNPWIKPDVAAPGVAIYSASIEGDDQYVLKNGTSMASPHTAGLVALLWSAKPDLMRNISDTEQALRDTAIPVADTSCDLLPTDTGFSGTPNSVWGYGRVSADVIYWPGSNGFYITPARQRQLGTSGETVTYAYFLVNQGSSEITADLTLSDSQWTTRLSHQSVTVPPHGKVFFSVEHGISYLPSPDEETVTVTASTAQDQAGASFSTRNLTPYTPTPGSVSHELLAENFEGDFPPSGWRLENLSSYDCGWTDGRTSKKENHTGGSGNFVIGATEICTEGMDTVLFTPTVDLNNVPPEASLWLEFKDYYNYEKTRGLLKMSRDGGDTWEEMAFSCEEPPCGNLFFLGNHVNGTLQFRFSIFNVSTTSYSRSWEVDDVKIHYLTAPESGAVIPSVNDKGCPGQSTSEMTLCNFSEKDVFLMTYDAPSGSVSGPSVVGPVFKNGILSFQVQTHTPDLPLGTTLAFTVTATGRNTGAVAVGTIKRTVDRDEWYLGTPMPYSTSNAPSFVYDGKIYVGGGKSNTISAARGEFIIFDPDSNGWELGAPQPYPYFTDSRCGVLGKNAEGEAVYTLFPGSDDKGTPWGVIHTYHMDRDVWTTTALPPQLPDVLYGPACVSDPQNNVGYISGGKTGAWDSGAPYAATLYRYHPDTGTVEELPEMTSPRSHHAAWLRGGMICAAGGTGESGTLDSTQCFDLSAGSWNPENSDLPKLPNPWSGMAYDLLKGNPFLAGAYGSIDSERWIPVALAYDSARGTWENLSSPPRARINVSGVTLNKVFHLMGGQKRLEPKVLESTTHQILTICDIAPPLPPHR
ncbi:MAG: S8 family serine peptidase [Deltaproteobacteria bacterium]|nr:S8 family serine peptidase [Deltaproteobacteria bacterium]